MATILNAYNLSGGDTTSSIFTSTGDCVTIEATTTNISGNNTYLKIQSSDDQTTWKDIGQILIGVGSDIYCIDPIKLTGLYVRVLLITNDTTTGTITVTASNQTGAVGGDLLASNNLTDVADIPTANHNLGNLHGTYTPVFTPDTGVTGTVTPLHESLYLKVDTEGVIGSMIVQIQLGGAETEAVWFFDLPIVPNNDFADQFDLQIVVGYPVNQIPNPNWLFKITAEDGTKTGKLFFQSDTAADSVIISFQYSYHNN